MPDQTLVLKGVNAGSTTLNLTKAGNRDVEIPSNVASISVTVYKDFQGIRIAPIDENLINEDGSVSIVKGEPVSFRLEIVNVERAPRQRIQVFLNFIESIATGFEFKKFGESDSEYTIPLRYIISGSSGRPINSNHFFTLRGNNIVKATMEARMIGIVLGMASTTLYTATQKINVVSATTELTTPSLNCMISTADRSPDTGDSVKINANITTRVNIPEDADETFEWQIQRVVSDTPATTDATWRGNNTPMGGRVLTLNGRNDGNQTNVRCRAIAKTGQTVIATSLYSNVLEITWKDPVVDPVDPDDPDDPDPLPELDVGLEIDDFNIKVEGNNANTSGASVVISASAGILIINASGTITTDTSGHFFLSTWRIIADSEGRYNAGSATIVATITKTGFQTLTLTEIVTWNATVQFSIDIINSITLRESTSTRIMFELLRQIGTATAVGLDETATIDYDGDHLTLPNTAKTSLNVITNAVNKNETETFDLVWRGVTKTVTVIIQNTRPIINITSPARFTKRIRLGVLLGYQLRVTVTLQNAQLTSDVDLYIGAGRLISGTWSWRSSQFLSFTFPKNRSNVDVTHNLSLSDVDDLSDPMVWRNRLFLNDGTGPGKLDFGEFDNGTLIAGLNLPLDVIIQRVGSGDVVRNGREFVTVTHITGSAFDPNTRSNETSYVWETRFGGNPWKKSGEESDRLTVTHNEADVVEVRCTITKTGRGTSGTAVSNTVAIRFVEAP